MRRGGNPHPAISVQIRIPPQCCEFGHGSQLVITDLLSVKKSATHVSEGAHRNISEIPVLKAGKPGYGFSGRTLPHRSKTGSHLCACSLTAELQTSNLTAGVQLPSRTPFRKNRVTKVFVERRAFSRCKSFSLPEKANAWQIRMKSLEKPN